MKEYDVIIVGSGFAGLFAAIEVAKTGASVIVLEKMEHFGGCSAMAAGQLAVPESDEQVALGIKDSKELLAKDMIVAGRGLNNLKLVNKFVSEMKDVYRDLQKLGVKFKKDVYPFHGHSISRVLLTENESGTDVYTPLFNHARKLGVVFKNKSFVEKILSDESSEILGIRVRDNYEFGNNLSGKICNYTYRKGLIISAGGWAADKRFISLQCPIYSELETTAHYGATSECLRFLLGLDAIPILLDSYQLGPWASPDEVGAGFGSNFADFGFIGGILINVLTGKRFVNEMADRKTIADAELQLKNKDGEPACPILLCGEEAATRSAARAPSLASGVLKKYKNLDELTAAYGIDQNNLFAEIQKWNRFVKNSFDADFGKSMQFSCPIEGEIYAMRLWPKVHYCNGGVAVSENAGLISMTTLKEIPRVYACGEITGGLHGECRLAAVSLLDAMVFGKTAGKSACRNI